jgi:hypothetical protein
MDIDLAIENLRFSSFYKQTIDGGEYDKYSDT